MLKKTGLTAVTAAAAATALMSLGAPAFAADSAPVPGPDSPVACSGSSDGSSGSVDGGAATTPSSGPAEPKAEGIAVGEPNPSAPAPDDCVYYKGDPGAVNDGPDGSGGGGMGNPEDGGAPVIGPDCEDHDGDGFVDDENCILYATGGLAPLQRPNLSQTSAKGVATLTVGLSPEFKGRKLVFFAKRANGSVRSLGIAKVGATGEATRILHLKKGQTVAVYAKVLGTTKAQLPNAYSHTVAFVVK